MHARTIFLNLIEFVFVLLFTYTAINKFISLASFRYTLGQSPFIGKYSSFFAIVLPVAELIIVLLLLFPRTKHIGLVASFGLMAIFCFYIGYALLAKLKLACSCGGVLQSLDWQQHFWMNLVLTTLAATAIHLNSNSSRKIKRPIAIAGDTENL